MVRRCTFRGVLTILAVFAARVASADPITFTGLGQWDLDPNTNSAVQVIPGMSDPLSQNAQPSWMTNAGYVSGWDISDIRTYYDKSSDTMYVAVDTFLSKTSNPYTEISGDAYGTGVEGDKTSQSLSNGINPSGFGVSIGSDKSITLSFAANNPNDPNSHGAAVLVAGIPAEKSLASTNTIDGFTVAHPNGSASLPYSYGTAIPNAGNLAFDPSMSHPELEFTIKNFSQTTGIDPTQGYWLAAYAGSAQDGSVGEVNLPYYHVPSIAGQTLGGGGDNPTPEPASVVLWTTIAGGALWRLRRRRGRG